jgi:hypothetical protein
MRPLGHFLVIQVVAADGSPKCGIGVSLTPSKVVPGKLYEKAMALFHLQAIPY